MEEVDRKGRGRRGGGRREKLKIFFLVFGEGGKEQEKV